VIAKQFENVFPELNKQLEFVTKVVKEEEEAFLRTLGRGLLLIDNIIKSIKEDDYLIDNEDDQLVEDLMKIRDLGKAGENLEISGKAAFELYDNFRFST